MGLIPRLVRSALFVLAGVELLIYWVVVHRAAEATALQATWPRVLWFSATLLMLGVAVLVFGRMVGAQAVKRWATVGFAAITLASLVNIVEDGLRIEEAFLAGIFLFITVGGPILLTTWLGAAAAALQNAVLAGGGSRSDLTPT